MTKGWLGLTGAALLAAGALQAQGSEYAIIAWLGTGLVGSAAATAFDARWGTVATAVLATVCNGYLLSRKLVAATGPSLCDINSTFDCDVVNSSTASELFGMPVTLFGVAFYIAIGVMALLANQRETPRFPQVNVALAVIGALFCGYMAFEATKLDKLCVFCITIYGAAVIHLWAAFRTLSTLDDAVRQQPAGAMTSRSAITAAITGAVVVLIGGSSWSNQTATPEVTVGDDGQIDASALAGLYSPAQGSIILDGTEPSMGPEDAAYTIVEWADFGCPHCAHAYTDLKVVLGEHRDVRLVFKPFALSGACNPVLEGTEGVERCKAAVAAECAHEQSKFWDFAGQLFKNQGYFGDADLLFMAGQVGLDEAQFGECMASSRPLESVMSDGKAGGLAGVQGTPALFLKGTHGEQFVLVRDPRSLVKIIEAHKEGASLPPPTL